MSSGRAGVKVPRRRGTLWLGLAPHAPRTGVPYVVVRIVVYVVTLILMGFLYGTKERGLFVAPPVALVGAAATWYLLGDTSVEERQRLLLAGGVGVLLAELTWALGYWDVAALVGGAALWLGLYVLSGIVEHGAARTLNRRIAAEYSAVAAGGSLIILLVARPWAG